MTVTTELVLLRHGETDWNRTSRFQGLTNTDLNELGTLQASAAAVTLADYRFDRIYSSSLARAAQTAEQVAKRTGLTVEYDPRLVEIDVGSWSGLTKAEVLEDFPEYDAMVESRQDFRRSPTGETLVEVGERIGPALVEIAERHPGERILVSTHGNSARQGIGWLLGWTYEQRMCLGLLGNASWAVLRVKKGRWTLNAYNRTAG
jgi:broad specificity phosphatase PhoE